MAENGNDSGANIATQAGNGDAMVLNWEPFHQTLNKLYQQDLYQQKQIKDAALKSQIELQHGAKNIRTADMPKFMGYFNGFKEASLMLQDPKVMRNAEQRAYWTQQQNTNMISGLAHTEYSKEFNQKENNVPLEAWKSKGVGMRPDYMKELTKSKSLSVDEAINQGFDSPTHYLNEPDIVQKDKVEQGLFGPKLVTPELRPKTENGILINEKYRIEKFQNEPAVVAIKSLHAVVDTPSLKDGIKQDYLNAQQSIGTDGIEKTMKEAEQLPNMQPLPRNEYGYYAAQNAIKAKPQEYLEGRSEDPVEKDKRDKALKIEMQNRSFNHADKMQKRAFAHSDARAANSQQSQMLPFDGSKMHSAALNGDEATVEEMGAKVAQNTNRKFVPISRSILADPKKRRRILEALNIGDSEFTGAQRSWPENESQENASIRLVIDALNAKADTRIRGSDLSGKKIIPIFMGQQQPPNKDLNGKYDGTVSNVKSFRVYNPNTVNAKTFNADLSNEYLKKNKAQTQQMQQQILEMNDEIDQ